MWASTAVRERESAKRVDFMVVDDGGHRAQVGFRDEKSVVCFVEMGTLPEGSVNDAQGKGTF